MNDEADKSRRRRSLTAIRQTVRQFVKLLPPNSRGHRRIELCGGIGVGKTTAAAALARTWSMPLFREAYQEVPFWEKYYRDPAEYELEKNVSFLLSYGDIIRNAAASEVGRPPQIFDFSLLQILAYCDLSLSPADTHAVEQLYARIAHRCGPPSLLIHVFCPIEEQVRRIRVRGRELEVNIDMAFLAALNDRIAARSADQSITIPVLEIDTLAADFSAHPEREALGLAERLVVPKCGPFEGRE